MDKKSIRGIAFLILFAALAYIALQVPVFALMGVTGKSFTLFEFFGPVAGAFIGLGGVIAVGLAKLANAAFNGGAFGIWDLAKLSPMMFAAYYFWKNGARGMNDRLGIIVPAIAMLAFWLHPIGQQAWIYAFYWLIPIAAKFLPDRLVLRSLGSTFTAHAVGSVLFLYTIPTAPALWLALIPIVAIERGAFAIGITASHILFTNILNAVDKAYDISKYVNVEKRYVLHI
jgi:hypothetical protein